MIKNIKKVGIIFLAIAIICLMVIGCLSVNMVATESNLSYEKRELAADIADSTDNEFSEDDYDIILTGSCDAMATEWDKAVTKSKENGGKQVKVLMKSHWIAKNVETNYKTSFGEYAESFNGGSICVPTGVNILLDINSYSIERNMKAATPNGMAIYVNGGTLTIQNNKYNEDKMKKLYNLYKDGNVDYLVYRLNSSVAGSISGGAAGSTGGAFYVSNNGTLNFNSGKIVTNKFAVNGAGIYAENSTININGGMIMDNKASTKGGGVFAKDSVLNVNGGMIIRNESINGGGIFALDSEVHIGEAIIHGNRIPVNAGAGAGLCLECCETTFTNGIVYANSNDYDGGGIYINGAEDKTSTFTMTGGLVSKNFAQFGAGIYVRQFSTAVLNGVEISENNSFSVGAGLFVYSDSECTINDTKIIKNYVNIHDTFKVVASGVGVGLGSTFTINSGLIADNYIKTELDKNGDTELTGGGAGICVLYASGANSKDILNLNGGIITRNKTFYEGAGIAVASTNCDINISKSLQVFDNSTYDSNGKSSDFYLKQGQKINITGKLDSGSEPQIGISLADDYGDEPFTSGYNTYNTDSPYMHFFNNKVSSIAALNNGDVVFENIISSNVYDFIYLENGTRKNYSDNNLIHAVNDYAKRQEVNGGKLVLGNIAPNTSVNQFISNINFDGTIIKLKDCVNNVVYGDGADSKFADKLNNGNEFAVGTGWRVEIYTNSGVLIEEMYLSVLGDLTGDGKVNSADVNLLRRMVNDDIKFETTNVAIQLSALIVNVGGSITNSDTQIIWEVACGRIDIRDFLV